jgi:hypothetical protein
MQRDFGAMINSKLHFNLHIDYIYPDALKLVGLTHFITYNFSSVNTLKLSHCALIRAQLAYMPVLKNDFTFADTNEL